MGLLCLYSRRNLKSHTGCVTSAYFTRTVKYQKQFSQKDTVLQSPKAELYYI